MELENVLSIIGLYILMLIIVCAAHVFITLTDNTLYEMNKYNENRKIMKFGLKWLFWRFKKEEPKEIFITTFIHQIISLIIFFIITFLLVITLIQKINLIMYFCFIPVFMYFLYCSIRQRHIINTINKRVN